MEKEIVELKRKSELEAKSENEYRKLMSSDYEFIPLEIINNEDDVELKYNVENLKECSEIKTEFKENILIFLINVSKLSKKIMEYKMNLEPTNLYIDYKFDVKVKFRDIKREIERFDDEEFLKQYKSLIGFMNQSKYEYSDYYNGGLDLLKKDKFLREVYDADSVESVKVILGKELEKLKEDTLKNKMLIEKKAFKKSKQIKNILGVATIILGGYFLYSAFIAEPYNTSIIKASNAFIQSDYEKVISSLKNVNTDKLSKESKYILANSYVNSENLSADQKKNILATISLQSQEEILEFWIAQGRMELDIAVDIAKRIGDNELLMYSLIKKEQQIINDDTLEGEEKEELLNKTNSDIDNLSEKLKETNN